MPAKASIEKQETYFLAAETYRICKLYQEEDILWSKNVADY